MGSVRSGRDNLARVLASAGGFLLPVAMFLLWYRDADADSGTLSAWGGYCFVIAEMLLLLPGRRRPGAGRPGRQVVEGTRGDRRHRFAFLVTITAVIALFIDRPGGKAAMAVAFGGFVGPAANGTIKGRRHLFHGGDLRGRRPPL